MALKHGDTIKALRSVATLKAGRSYKVGKPLDDGTVRLTNDVYLYGPSACYDLKEGVT